MKSVEDELWFKMDRVDYWEAYGEMPEIRDIIDMKMEMEAEEE